MATTLSITSDTRGVSALLKSLEVMGHKAPSATALVLNRIATRTKQRVIPALTHQTGLNKRIIVKAVRQLRASPKNLRAGLVSRGGNISYRYFSAREENGGVVAEVAGRRVTLPGAFRRSGRAPNRYAVKKLGGQVYINPSRRWRGEIEKQRSGVFIPEEMIAGATLRAFEQVVASELPVEIARELSKLATR